MVVSRVGGVNVIVPLTVPAFGTLKVTVWVGAVPDTAVTKALEPIPVPVTTCPTPMVPVVAVFVVIVVAPLEPVAVVVAVAVGLLDVCMEKLPAPASTLKSA